MKNSDYTMITNESKLFKNTTRVLSVLVICLVYLATFLYVKSYPEFVSVIIGGVNKDNIGDALIVYPSAIFGLLLFISLLTIPILLLYQERCKHIDHE